MNEQPRPIPNENVASWELVIHDLAFHRSPYARLVIDDARERDRMGAEKYGTRLQPHNGRDSLRDAYEESLDLIVYLRNKIAESWMDDESVSIYWASVAVCLSIRGLILLMEEK
jgi:hypothetical protein